MLDGNSKQDTVFKDGFSKEVWASTYKDHKDENVNDTFRRVANSIASAEKTPEKQAEWSHKFYDMLTNFKGVAGGRITANAGTDWAGTTFANCYVGPLPDRDLDSINGIYKVLVDQANTLKSEGGWGMDFSWVRPRGSFINGIGVESPGSVRFMELFDKSSEIVTAGSGEKSKNKKAKGKIRKGAMMATMSISHPDIIEFIKAKQTPGRLSKFNMSVNCTDRFMDRVNKIHENELAIRELEKNAGKLLLTVGKIQALREENERLDKWDLIFPDTTYERYKAEWQGDIEAWQNKGYPVIVHETVSVTWLWNLTIESTYNRNEPGILFLDRANYYAPLNYAEKTLSTNPSMPAGTLVHTKDGIFKIEELQDKDFEVKSMNGSWASANCFLSSESEPVLEFNIGSNKSIKSTKQHKWPVYHQSMDRVYKVDAGELNIGDLIPMNRNESIGIYGDMSLTEEEGLFVGYLLGDGWFNLRADNGRLAAGITFGKAERESAEKIIEIARRILETPSLTLSERESEIYFQFGSDFAKEKLFNRYKLIPGVKDVPESVWKGNDLYTKGFVDGLLSADGSVSVPNTSITLTTSREDFAKNYAKLLSFAGIATTIYTQTTTASFPNGKDYDKKYTRWDVRVGGGAVIEFNNVFTISHPDKKAALDGALAGASNIRYVRTRSFVEIQSITELPPEKVWDISVDHPQHVFPSEWCYTGNCGEQTLAAGGVCCLGTINLTQFINSDYSGFDLESLSKYVGYMVRFLDNVNEISETPLPEYKHSMREKRRIGCGVMGWGSALFMLQVKFGSERADKLREQVMSTYARAAYMASIDLAEEKGKFSYCEPSKHVQAPFIKSLGLSKEYMDKLGSVGIRNSSLLSQQPNGNSSIFANITSGGIEPIFMPEYIRTVMVQIVPEEFKDQTPNFTAGDMSETEFFKEAKEGDERILRGVSKDGTVYKIDSNRGLTKEVLCQDYGVRDLVDRGLWDPKADYTVTTTDLSVGDHVSDLEGFARWTDSACSKTCNIPNDYPFEDFKNLYLDVYNTGVIKGFTTYRSGTMTSVLSAVKETPEAEEEIILEEIKLPDSLPATLKTIRAEGRKWYLTVILNETQTKPVALFTHTNNSEKTVTANDAIEHLLELALIKGIPQKHIAETLEKARGDTNTTKICRMISLCLRHGVLIRNLISSLDKVDCIAGTFVFHIRKYLSTFIKDGEKVLDENCSECGSSHLVYQEGCKICLGCATSKCG